MSFCIMATNAKLQIHEQFISCIWKQLGRIIVDECFVCHHLRSFPSPSLSHRHYSLTFISFILCL